METEVQMILIEKFCKFHSVKREFIESLCDCGLLSITTIEEKEYIPDDDLPHLEKMSRLHYELGVNIQGIEVAHHLLQNIEQLQQEINQLRNRLG